MVARARLPPPTGSPLGALAALEVAADDDALGRTSQRAAARSHRSSVLKTTDPADIRPTDIRPTDIRPADITSTLIDSHAHLDAAFYEDELDKVIEEARAALAFVVTVGSGGSLSSPREAVEMAERHDFIYATVGMHPHDAQHWSDTVRDELATLARHQRVVAIGETGLDYYYDLSPRDAQRDVLRQEIRLAREVGKPLVLHIREAWDDALTILDEEGASEVGGVVHCFTGDAEQAKASLERGFHIGVTGIATYGHSKALRRILRELPLDRLLVETDSPFLTPQAAHGIRPNRPAFVRHVAEALAKWRKVDVEEIVEATAANTRRLFGLPISPLSPALTPPR